MLPQEETGKTLSKTVDNLNGKHTFNFKAREVSVGGAFEACAYSDKLDKEFCPREQMDQKASQRK